ncbi:MAG TPA: hypothetical protein VGE01_09515 [Fimbriimonas sp.]
MTPDLDRLLASHPRLQGEPAFDPQEVRRRAESLPIRVDAGHPLLDQAVRVGLAHIDLTFQGDHPKYGAKAYFQAVHDGFPPTIIAAVDALSAWGLLDRASELWSYWLQAFVGSQGEIHYYGTSLSEYGQLLHTGVLLAERGGSVESALMKPLADRVVGLVGARPKGVLLEGVPEADEADRPRRYFHNNAWLAKGLSRWNPGDPLARSLAKDTLDALRDTWGREGWLSPEADPTLSIDRPRGRITDTRLGSYTNYRYWPELLSSGLLTEDLAQRVVQARLDSGGDFHGATRFEDWLDDWPLFDYLQGLWSLRRRDDFLRSLYAHVALHQAEGHLTAYEQVSLPPGREKAPYCLPCQLVVPRAVAMMRSGG